jgi:ribosomal protein S18 acetylase RimI-like enzyme
MCIVRIAPISDSTEIRAALADMLIETVASGGSVSFMHPLSPEHADSFWDASLEAASHGARIVLGAWCEETFVGTVTLLLDMPPNQPHRAEIAKLMVRQAFRGHGIAAALIRAAEGLAIQHGRTLLVLDTAVDGGARGLYEKAGFTLTGEIPDYALKPHGGLTGTLIYWKRIGAADRTAAGNVVCKGKIGGAAPPQTPA